MELPSLRLLGVQRTGPYPAARRDAWQTLDRALTARGASCRDFVQVGIPLDWPEITPEPRRRYQACVVSGLEPGSGVFQRSAAGGSYAVFRFEGSCDRLQQVHEAILRQWSPRKGFALRDAPSLHRYLEPVTISEVPARLRVDICVPVRREAGHQAAA
jgi:DNA gyrase inhibitor GyrI